MSEIIYTSNISNRCAPVAAQKKPQGQQPRVWSLTQLKTGQAGNTARTLSCLVERQTDGQGNYRGEALYPIVGDIQFEPGLAASMRNIEFRTAIKVDGSTGLIYRKHPADSGYTNSWLTSAEAAMQSLVGNWGRVSSDTTAQAYRFETLNLPGQGQPAFPDIDELIDELLADYVIDRLDHPVLQQLLKPDFGSAAGTMTGLGDDTEEDIDEIY